MIWIKDKLQNLPIEFVDGDRSSKYPKREEFVSVGIPFLNAEAINAGYLNLDKSNYITEAKFSTIKKGRLHDGDLILTTRGNGVGKVAYFSSNICKTGLINAQLLIIRPNPQKIYPKFLYYSFISSQFQSLLKNFVSGSAQPQLPIQSLKDVELSYPNLSIQHKIASILSAYDDLIENNTRRIKILEEMAQMLYRKWFVNFRFPDHENVKMVESAIGLIPEGWEVTTIGSVCLVGDGAHASIKRQKQGIVYLTCKNFKNGNLDLTKVDYISEDDYHKYFKNSSKSLTKPKLGDILFSIIGTIGSPYLFKVNDKFGLSSSVAILRPNHNILLSNYLYYWIKNDIFQNALHGIKGGVAQGYVSLEMIRSLPLCYPNKSLQKEFDIYIDPTQSLIEALIRKNINLRKTRDLLLPKLISGEIDVENLDIETLEIAA